MEDVLTWDEIVAKYPDEWVLIDEPDLEDDIFDVIRGRVVAHSADVDDVYAAGRQLKLRDSAFLYTGEPDPNLVVILTLVLSE